MFTELKRFLKNNLKYYEKANKNKKRREYFGIVGSLGCSSHPSIYFATLIAKKAQKVN